MTSSNSELLDTLLTNAGLNPTRTDKEKLLPILEIYQARLKILHSIDLDEEEVSGGFDPLGLPGMKE
ncbi:hypothetical protein FIM02_01575 [SAR202 cluster bacterium AD-802-E10_MRT_200m]|nr:hypothetical protein [SAR202 cluster bacterium AD-802-E10_MRT_200m]